MQRTVMYISDSHGVICYPLEESVVFKFRLGNDRVYTGIKKGKHYKKDLTFHSAHTE